MLKPKRKKSRYARILNYADDQLPPITYLDHLIGSITFIGLLLMGSMESNPWWPIGNFIGAGLILLGGVYFIKRAEKDMKDD